MADSWAICALAAEIKATGGLGLELAEFEAAVTTIAACTTAADAENFGPPRAGKTDPLSTTTPTPLLSSRVFPRVQNLLVIFLTNLCK